MKSFRKCVTAIISALLAVLFVTTVAACKKPEPTPSGPKVQKYNPETRPLVMSISQPDGVYNPFFSTSGYDSTILGMTQISMLNADKKGSPVCGDNEPVVVQDWQKTYNAKDDTTKYEFIIKNGIKFSDGTPLTIKDVLFNLYVYLDPVYTGSATIYSTDIVGLKEYRMQDLDASDKGLATFEESFVNEARTKIDDLVEFMQAFGKYTGTTTSPKPTDRWTADEKKSFKSDYTKVAKEFREELYSDWNSTTGSMESYRDWKFTDAWQVFLLNDGGCTELLATDAEGKYIKDKDGNFQLDTEQADAYKQYLDSYLADHNKTQSDSDAIKEWAVNFVYYSYFPSAVTEKYDYDEHAFDADRIDSSISVTEANGFEQVVRYWQTADTVLNDFAANAKSEYFAKRGKVVSGISGIKVEEDTTTDYHGKNLGEAHSVLSITINGIDPKAIWNFAFTVAPLHYYSGTYTNKKNEKKDYVAEFDAEEGNFGLEFGDSDFMNTVLNAPEKVGLPLGAGAYMASTKNGGVAKNGSEFFNLNMVYYERNPYFETLGKGIENAKIKYFRYRVVDTDQVINSISTKEIDVGDPNGTVENINKLDESKIAHEEIYTNGYGYVGINPRFVPNINIRRAIMKAMDTRIITNEYYQNNLAELIYRPMSTTSWAYPKGATVYTAKRGAELHGGEVKYDYDKLGTDIEKIVVAEGYLKGNDGVYYKDIPGFGTDRLDYQFTIAGQSDDHPAYNMFLNAQKVLNQHGFAVKVVKSQKALSDLTLGKLEVWAAAWSSTVDPDMYQVYHKDSKATSVNNWGYKQIKANGKVYSTEQALIEELSRYIDAGRDTDDQDERTDIYKTALELVMELAVEMPTYQRKDMTAYNSELIDETTLIPEKERSPYNGLFARIWEVNFN